MELNIPSLLPARVKLGETEFNRLFLDYYPRICRAAYIITGDRQEAEDLSSETFWRLWSTPPGSSQNIPAWLFRVVTNLAYNAVRTHRRRENRENISYNHGVGIETQSVDELVQLRLNIEAVRNIWKKMDRRDVQVLVLRHSGLAYRDIAAVLSVPISSVGTMLIRAEKKFALLYGGGGGDALQ